jgi:4-aminobutyrate aminotransferase-like enzyme
MDAPEPGSMSTTYAGNPLVATAALAVLEIMDEERLLENATKLGNEALESLSELKGRYEFVGDIRCKGLVMVIEKNRGRVFFPWPPGARTRRLLSECRRVGSFTEYNARTTSKGIVDS